jgi:hypothetical protein
MNEKRSNSFSSRRQFLQTSTAVGAGLLLSERLASTLHAAGTDKDGNYPIAIPGVTKFI